VLLLVFQYHCEVLILALYM